MKSSWSITYTSPKEPQSFILCRTWILEEPKKPSFPLWINQEIYALHSEEDLSRTADRETSSVLPIISLPSKGLRGPFWGAGCACRCSLKAKKWSETKLLWIHLHFQWLSETEIFFQTLPGGGFWLNISGLKKGKFLHGSLIQKLPRQKNKVKCINYKHLQRNTLYSFFPKELLLFMETYLKSGVNPFLFS